MEIDLHAALTKAGFHVQRMGYEQVISEKSLREKIESEFGNTPLASILRNYPTYFLMHSEIEPEQGYAFCVVSDSADGLSAEAKEVYEKYFPPEVFIVQVNEDEREVSATWFSEPDDWERLSDFLSSKMGIKDVGDLKTELSSQGWTA